MGITDKLGSFSALLYTHFVTLSDSELDKHAIFYEQELNKDPTKLEFISALSTISMIKKERKEGEKHHEERIQSSD